MAQVQIEKGYTSKKKSDYFSRLSRDLVRNRSLYLLVLPVLLFYMIFHYGPMYGAIIAFKDYSPARGILFSNWAGFAHFLDFFNSYYIWRIIGNTITINLMSLVFGFPAPIILALLLNELKNKYFKSTVQTVSYLPHFISLVVVCGLIKDFTASEGIITQFLGIFGAEQTSLLQRPELFKSIYVLSDIWQSVGWGSILYLAALTNVDPQLYEAATIDGAGRWKQTIHITIPGILPTIIIMLILRLGNMMNVGFEKIILLYNPLTYPTADVISTFVYRKGILEFSWSFSAAVGLFNSVINFALLVLANTISRKVNETSLW